MSILSIPHKALLLIVLVFLSVSALAAPVNINTASAEEIAASLDGVGLAKARAIVAYRNANGPFETRQSLADVKGIGERTIALNEANIVLSEEAKSD